MPAMGKPLDERRARLAMPRLARELKTIRAMLRIACRERHGTAAGLCAECTALADYAARRLAFCPYGADKPTCVNCRIHCYGPRRFAGPRMLLRHPYLAVMHVVDGRRPAPPRRNEAAAPAVGAPEQAARTAAEPKR